MCVRLCVCARSTVSLGTCTTSTVLMLNQSRVVNTLPFPERDTEVLQNSSCVATLVEHGVFILLYSPPPPEKSGEHARVGEVTGVRECGRWEIDFMYVRERTCVFSRVGYQHGPLPSAQSLHSALSLSAL